MSEPRVWWVIAGDKRVHGGPYARRENAERMCDKFNNAFSAYPRRIEGGPFVIIKVQEVAE